jgi:hypothetical protein
VRKIVMVERWWRKNEVMCRGMVRIAWCLLCFLLDVTPPPNQNLNFLFRNYRCLNCCSFQC